MDKWTQLNDLLLFCVFTLHVYLLHRRVRKLEQQQ